MQKGGDIQKTARDAGVQKGSPKLALASKMLESLTLMDVMAKMPPAAHIVLKRSDGAETQGMRKITEVVAGYLELLERGNERLQYSKAPSISMNIMQLVNYFMPDQNIEMILIKPPKGSGAGYEREVEIAIGPQMDLVTLAFASSGTVEKDGDGNLLYIKGMFIASPIRNNEHVLGIWMEYEGGVHPNILARVASAYGCEIEVHHFEMSGRE